MPHAGTTSEVNRRQDSNVQGSHTKDHTRTHVVLVHVLCTPLLCTEPWEDCVHAKPMTDATPSPSLARGEPVGAGARLPGVHAAKLAILMPAQTPYGQALPWTPQRGIQALLYRRLRSAHGNSSVKRCCIVTTGSAWGRRTSALSSWISVVRCTACGGAQPLALPGCIALHSPTTSARFVRARTPHYALPRFRLLSSPGRPLYARFPAGAHILGRPRGGRGAPGPAVGLVLSVNALAPVPRVPRSRGTLAY